MLNEILLSLSGVPSPIWSQVGQSKHNAEKSSQAYVSSSEQAMLTDLSNISKTHIRLKENIIAISARHPSSVCRAVSSSIDNVQLAVFRSKITDTERLVIQKDASFVGGYNFVPLSTIVAEFAPWTRRLEWLLKTTEYMVNSGTDKGRSACSAAQLMNYLEVEHHTGYSDIETAAVALLTIAQRTWMRSISSWILYGQLPSCRNDDFMVRRPSSTENSLQYELGSQLIPAFVTKGCADDILASGNALNQVRSQSITRDVTTVTADILTKLLPTNLGHIQTLTYPLQPSLLETTMRKVNQSISHNALSELLPRNKIIELVQVIQAYLLLGRGEFAVSLISHADTRSSTRQSSQSVTYPVRKLGRVEDIVMKETELNAILAQTWSDLAALQGDTESEEAVFVTARRYLRLKILEQPMAQEDDVTLATLLPSTSVLRFELPVDSPLRIFLSESDVTRYAEINAYLLSMRRCGLRLSSLWKLTGHRRCYPTPLAPPLSATVAGQQALASRRKREDLRIRQTRRYWSSMSKTLFVVNELGAYLQGEVIQKNGQHFYSWLTGNRHQSLGTDHLSTFSKHLDASQQVSPSPISTKTALFNQTTKVDSIDDPRALANAHRLYLDNLFTALLLHNRELRRSLRSLFDLVDHFVALFTRLQLVWQGLDLQEDDGVLDAFTNYAKDEADVLAEMNRSRDELEEIMQHIVTLIQEIENEKGTSDVAMGMATISLSTDANGSYVPWRARSLDRLIMKLDFFNGGKRDDSDEMDEFEDALP